MEIKDIIKEFTDLLESIGGDFGLQLLDILGDFIPRIELIDRLPEWARPLIQPFAANVFLHAIIGKLKDFDVDRPETRKLALNYTIKLFQMPNNWEPDWVFSAVS